MGTTRVHFDRSMSVSGGMITSSDEENMLGDGFGDDERIEWPGIRSICLILLEMPDTREEKRRREEERREKREKGNRGQPSRLGKALGENEGSRARKPT